MKIAAASSQELERTEADSGLVSAVYAVGVLSLAELLVMSLWFAPAAVVGALARQWEIGAEGPAWLTMAVQLGFVAGTLALAVSNLADLLKARYLLAASALLASAANAAPVVLAGWVGGLLGSRFLTGVFLAGVYPIAMKIAASWFRKGRGLAMGWLIGALTVGSASPYLLRGTLGSDWRPVLLTASGLACIGALLVAFLVGDGPFDCPSYRFRWRRAVDAARRSGVALSTLGYMGHMWELYAMWTWVPVYLAQALGGTRLDASLVSFWVIAAGAIGCVGGGFLADRKGRTTVTIGAMWTSGACALMAGPAAAISLPLFLSVCILWGISVIADSAQFSACVTELAAPDEVGTALTLQTCVGFLLTIASIRLMPAVARYSGWSLAFTMLALGPFIGSIAMWRLRMLPAARAALAGGKG